MTDISSLPLEIQRQCVGYLDGASLKEFRLTSRAYKDVAAEALFAVVTLRVDEESARNFSKILANEHFRRSIRTVSVTYPRSSTEN